MKKFIILLLILIAGCRVACSQIRSNVDERFELTSIAFRLAGMPEYSRCAVVPYATDIDTYFAAYANHELFGYIRMLRDSSAIAYNAVPIAAAMLEIKGGKLRLQPQYTPADVAREDPRWSEEHFTKFLKLLNNFYRQSDFRKFYEEHRPLYDLAESRLNELLREFDSEWFGKFFGRPFDPELRVYVSLCNGASNYAINDGILIGAWSVQDEPAFNPDSFYTLVHEFAHHYTNPLCDTYWPHMQSAAEKMFPVVREEMLEAAYGNAWSMLVEWMNNLFVLMYYKDTHNMWLNVYTRLNVDKGFIWMRRSIDFMDNFRSSRVQYPYIVDFMPQLVGFLNFTADNMDFVKREFDFRHPYIKNVYPAVGSDIIGVTEIRVKFSEPMRTDCQGLSILDNPEIGFLPFDRENCRWEDNSTFVISIQPDTLRPGRTYGIALLPDAFLSEKQFKLDDKYVDLIFKTGCVK